MYNPVLLPFVEGNIPPDRGGSYQSGSIGSSYQNIASPGNTYVAGNSTGGYTSNPGVLSPGPTGIRVNESGTYLVSANIKTNEKNQGNTFAVGVNGSVTNTNTHNTFSTNGSGNQTSAITTQLKLNKGDEVSLYLVSPGVTQLVDWTSTGANAYAGSSMLSGFGGGAGGGGAGLTEVAGSPSLAMSMVKIA